MSSRRHLRCLWLGACGLLLLAGCVRAKPPRTRTLSPELYPQAVARSTRLAQGYPEPTTPVPTLALPSPTATPSLPFYPPPPTLVETATLVPSPAIDTPTPTLVLPTPTATLPSVGDVIHTVARGENLIGIANYYGTTVQAIMNKNGIRNQNWIFAGQQLVIPLGYVPQETATPQLAEHWVQSGETLSQIARRYNTSVTDIQAYNPNIGDPNHLSPGTRLIVPRNTQAPSLRHTVRYGESLSSIARRYGVSVQALVQANALANPNHVYVGQVLIIPR